MKIYREKVHFVVLDLDVPGSPEQQKLVKEYYKITKATFLTSCARCGRPGPLQSIGAKSTHNTPRTSSESLLVNGYGFLRLLRLSRSEEVCSPPTLGPPVLTYWMAGRSTRRPVQKRSATTRAPLVTLPTLANPIVI